MAGQEAKIFVSCSKIGEQNRNETIHAIMDLCPDSASCHRLARPSDRINYISLLLDSIRRLFLNKSSFVLVYKQLQHLLANNHIGPLSNPHL